jgi:hypothetical protein
MFRPGRQAADRVLGGGTMFDRGVGDDDPAARGGGDVDVVPARVRSPAAAGAVDQVGRDAVALRTIRPS